MTNVIIEVSHNFTVSMDNIAPPAVCILFGMLQHKYGPRMVNTFHRWQPFKDWSTSYPESKTNVTYRLLNLNVVISYPVLSYRFKTVKQRQW